MIVLRRIDLSEYEVELLGDNGYVKVPYPVKDSIDAALYNPNLKLNYKELFENDRVAQKIRSSNGSVLLEESEYNKLKHAFEVIEGFTKKDLELVRRIIEAPEVDVKEA